MIDWSDIDDGIYSSYEQFSSYVVLNEEGIAALEELATVEDDSIVDKDWK